VAQDPYRYFRIEARELLDQLARSVLDLEKAADASDGVARLLRLAHTLKGAARVVNQREIAEQAHSIEDLLGPLRDTPEPVSREQTDAVLKMLDAVGGRLAALSPPSGADSVASGNAPPDDTVRTVRADIGEVDTLLDSLAETRARLTEVQQGLGELERVRRLMDTVVEQGSARDGREQWSGGVAEIVRASPPLAAEVRAALGGVAQGMTMSVDQMDRELRQMRSAAERLRLVRAGALFDTLERTVRDAGLALGKPITFEGRGGEVRLDAHVLGEMQGALVQLVRNAAAHGIEAEGERIGAGKPPAGRIVVKVSRRGRRIAFSCADDGAGVDVEAVRQAALRKGLLTPAMGVLDAEDLLRLLLRGGISTSSAVTEVSGRGIGLDIVREAAERVGGEVVVHTQTGAGTTIELLIPLSVAALDVLLIETPAGVMAIPLDAVRRVLHQRTYRTARTAQGETILFDGQAVPFIPLSALIGAGPTTRLDRSCPAVVVEGTGGTVAIGVDRFLGSASVVLRRLPELAPSAPIVAGTTLDADGNPQLVLDPDGLVAAALGPVAWQEDTPIQLLPVLVVDDSLTTRMLEKSILESAGYRVETAKSGEEGLEQARRERFALFLVDVEMPGMDGFTFIEHARRDAALRDIPALLVTSRGSPDDRQRGSDVGAQGYIVKSEFDQREFLQTVGRLVGGSR